MKMRFARHRYARRSIFSVAVSTLALASCAMQDPTEDQQSDKFDGPTQGPAAPVCSGGVFTCKSYVRVDENNRIKPFAKPSGFGPADLASAYKLNASITSTATIAIVDAFHYANAESDLATYRSTFGLPPCTVASGCLKIVNQNGATSPLPAAPPAGDDWNLEAALDLDMASAACPTCKLVLVEAQDDTSNGLFIAQNAAAALAGVVSISNSWGGPSSSSDSSLDSQFFTHTQSVNVFVSSGDSGNTGSTGDFPSTSAHVFAVGGTHLVKSSTTRGWTETAWSGAGSTCSTRIAEPSFQIGTVPTAACTMRAASDISAVADPNTGLAVFNANDGGFIVVGGTSASCPFIAAIFARYIIPPPGGGNDPEFPYFNQAEFFDITSGSNGRCASALCRAGTGWDGPTGIGSPNGAALKNNRVLETATAFVNETDGTWLMPNWSHPGGRPDLGFIKTSNTPSGNVEVHIASADSNYQTRILETPTTFQNETDGTWLMANWTSPGGKPDLVFIKTNNTPSGYVEVHIASAASNYRTRVLETATTFVNEADGTWLMANWTSPGGKPDLVFIKTNNTPSGHVEVHVASAASNYQTRVLEIPTTFVNETDGTWLMPRWTNPGGQPDQGFIKANNTPSGRVEVHIAAMPSNN